MQNNIGVDVFLGTSWNEQFGAQTQHSMPWLQLGSGHMSYCHQQAAEWREEMMEMEANAEDGHLALTYSYNPFAKDCGIHEALALHHLADSSQ